MKKIIFAFMGFILLSACADGNVNQDLYNKNNPDFASQPAIPFDDPTLTSGVAYFNLADRWSLFIDKQTMRGVDFPHDIHRTTLRNTIFLNKNGQSQIFISGCTSCHDNSADRKFIQNKLTATNQKISGPSVTTNAQGHVTSAATRTITLPTYSNMRGASTSAAGTAGLVPAPTQGAANRYLRSDGTWQVPPDTNTTYSTFTGASSSAAGTSGLVPAPSQGASTRYLRSDGTWATPTDTNTTYTAGDGITLSGTTFSLEESGVTGGSYGPTANVTGNNNTTVNIPQITVDSYGRVTSITNRVYTSVNTDTNTTYDDFTGADSDSAGTSGLVPGPSAGASNRYLRSDGTWAVPTDTNTTYSAGTGLSLSGTTINHASSITAGNVGPSANATPSFGNTFNVPYIVYNSTGHVTSVANRTVKIPSIPNNVLTTSQILTSLSGVSSNSYVLGAKVVADAINAINTNLDNYLPLSGGTCTGKVTVPTLGITSNASISWNSSKSAIQISF